jgi:hypothetical protein
MKTNSTKTPQYTNEELEMFVSTKNYKTMKSTFLIHWASAKLQIRLWRAALIGLFGVKDK